MIGTKRVSIFAAVALAIAMAGAPAYAASLCTPGKNKVKGCKNEIKGCAGNFGCAKAKKLKGKCTKACKTATVNACKANNSVCTASPSGAFLEL